MKALSTLCVFGWFKGFRDGKENVEDELNLGQPSIGLIHHKFVLAGITVNAKSYMNYCCNTSGGFVYSCTRVDSGICFLTTPVCRVLSGWATSWLPARRQFFRILLIRQIWRLAVFLLSRLKGMLEILLFSDNAHIQQRVIMMSRTIPKETLRRVSISCTTDVKSVL